MTAYQRVRLPADGEKIRVAGGRLSVPDRPIVGFVEGDGIGPDITRASLRVWDAAVEKAYGGRRKIRWCELYMGEKAAATYDGDCFPAETLAAMRDLVVSIKGPLTTPVGGGFRSLNVSLRQELDLYACVRPVRYYAGVPSPMLRQIGRDRKLRLVHAAEELPRVARQRLDVSALAFGIERVERQGGFSRAGQAGHHHQAVAGKGDVDVFQIVLPGAPDDDAVGFHKLPFRDGWGSLPDAVPATADHTCQPGIFQTFSAGPSPIAPAGRHPGAAGGPMRAKAIFAERGGFCEIIEGKIFVENGPDPMDALRMLTQTE